MIRGWARLLRRIVARPEPVVAPELPAQVEEIVAAAYLDYDVYRVASWLPGERDYRVGGR